MSERNKPETNNLTVYDVIKCAEPKPRNDTYPCFDKIKSGKVIDIYRRWDLAWALATNFDETMSVPTWSAQFTSN